jgi:hypothetical protein
MNKKDVEPVATRLHKETPTSMKVSLTIYCHNAVADVKPTDGSNVPDTGSRGGFELKRDRPIQIGQLAGAGSEKIYSFYKEQVS